MTYAACPSIATCPDCAGFDDFDARAGSALLALGNRALEAAAPGDVAAAFVQLVADCANQAAWGLVEQALAALEKVVERSLEALETGQPGAQSPDISWLPEPHDMYSFPESLYLSQEDVQARVRRLIAACSEHDAAVTTSRCRKTAPRYESLGHPDSQTLRLGFMSADFRGAHPSAFLLWGLMCVLACAPKVEVCIYPTQTPDLQCTLIAKLFGLFPPHRIRDISPLSVVERCALILSDELHVLLDVCGHTYGSTPSLIRALHGAEGGPWVVSYLADPGGPCDGRTAQLVDFEAYHKDGMCSQGPVARLPPGISYQPAPHALFLGLGILDGVERLSAAEMGLPDLQLDGSWTVFLCPNRAARHGRMAWGLVEEIVHAHEKGYLLLVDQGCKWSSERLVSKAKAAGLPEGHSRIWPSQAHALHFRRLAWLRRMELDGKLRVVVLVNAIGYPCHTQLGDCLAFGFCVVVMCARTDPAFHRRVVRSIFAGAGLLEFVAEDEVQYKRIAADFAADGPMRRTYEGLLGRCPAADPVNPFFNIQKNTQHFLALMYTLKGVAGSQLPKVIDVSEEAARLAAAQCAGVAVGRGDAGLMSPWDLATGGGD